MNITNDNITEARVLPDSQAIDRAVEIILNDENPTFIFIHIDEIDEAGHSRCFGDYYDKCILESDSQLSQVLKAIKQRGSRIKKNDLQESPESQETIETINGN